MRLISLNSKGFKFYQIDVKCDFLNGVIHEEIYVSHFIGFKNPKYFYRVYNFSKVVYGLKQVPRTWYAELKTFLL
jgi:hypothetical protein